MRTVKHGNNNRFIPVIAVCGILLLIWQVLAGGDGQGETGQGGLLSQILQAGRDQSIRNLLPVLAEHTTHQEEQEGMILQKESLEEWMPGYLYQTQAGQVAVRQEGAQDRELPQDEGEQSRELSLEELMRQENQDQLREQEEEGVVMLDLERLLEENGWDTQEFSEEAEVQSPKRYGIRET